jgi:multidrug resistance protein
VQEHDQYYEAGDEIYNKFSPTHKMVIVTILSCCAFLGPISSTSILAASPEVVATYNTTGAIFGLSNALYLIFMGLSPLVYGPLGTTYGRKGPLTVAAVTFTAFSAGSALAPNLTSYFVFRMLTAFQGTCFYIVGAAVIGDIYRPVERGTAYGWFLSGTLIGPALGPFVGGIIVTYASWRDIFWLQTALAGASTLGVIFLVPETIHRKRSTELADLPRREKARKLWSWINPWRVFVLFRYPNILAVGLASASLVFNMYSLLTPIRYVLNPRFHLTSPLQSGLFYIAPGAGYLVGTFGGGRYADYIVKKYIRKRGKRVPEDRLHSCLSSMGVVIPVCMLIYGWSIEERVGGIPLPTICMFIQGVGQLFCFPSLNTYCVDVMQKRSAEVLAGNYVIRYVFAAAGTAACLPVIDRIGVGWFSTISALFMVVAAGFAWMTAVYGSGWRERVEKGEREE